MNVPVIPAALIGLVQTLRGRGVGECTAVEAAMTCHRLNLYWAGGGPQSDAAREEACALHRQFVLANDPVKLVEAIDDMHEAADFAAMLEEAEIANASR